MLEPSSFDVSVVIPLFNKADFVGEAVESVLRQTLAPKEIIVIDDGSSDGGGERVRRLADDRITVFTQTNQGPSAARNRGVAEASCNWIAFLDADDIWLEDHLATLAEAAEAFPKAPMLGTDFFLGQSRPTRKANHKPSMIEFFDIRPPGPFCASSVGVRRSVIVDSGGFPPYWPGEDIHLWVRLALDHEVAVSSKATAIYRQQTGGLMDQSQGRFGKKVEMQPIFATLDAAIADQRYAGRRRAIERYRDQWLAIFARQALAAGRPEVASAYLDSMKPGSREADLVTKVMARLPGPVARAVIHARSALRRT